MEAYQHTGLSDENSRDRLSALAPELMRTILDQLDAISLVRLRGVSKHMSVNIHVAAAAASRQIVRMESARLQEASTPLRCKDAGILDACRHYLQRNGLPKFDPMHYFLVAVDFAQMYVSDGSSIDTNQPALQSRARTLMVIVMVLNASLHHAVVLDDYTRSIKGRTRTYPLIHEVCSNILHPRGVTNLGDLERVRRAFSPRYTACDLDQLRGVFFSILETPLSGELWYLQQIDKQLLDLVHSINDACGGVRRQVDRDMEQFLRLAGLSQLSKGLAYVPRSNRIKELVSRFMEDRKDHLLLAAIWEDMRVLHLASIGM